MSSPDPDESIDPEQNLTPVEIDDLIRLEALAQRRLGSYVLVGTALAEIRDRHLYRAGHASFEAYMRERWGLSSASSAPLLQTAHAGVTPTAELEPRTPLRKTPCEALARACEQTLSALEGDDRLGIEVRLVVRQQRDRGTHADGRSLDPAEVREPVREEVVPTLRWLLTKATGTIGEVAHQLETRAAEIDDDAREQLRDDVLVLDGELAVVKALLLELVDWDSEFRLLLEDELPPLDSDPDSDPDE